MLHRRSWYALPALVAASLLWSLAGPAAPAAAAAEYGCITIVGEKKPALYLEFKGKELRMAPTLEGLANAKPVKAAQMQTNEMGAGQIMAWYRFPEVGLPIAMQGVSSIKATLGVDRIVPVGKQSPDRRSVAFSNFSVTFRVERKGAAGAGWTYVLGTSSAVTSDKNEGAIQACTAWLPPIDKLTLAIETKIEGKKARIGLRVGAGPPAQLATPRGAGPLVPTISIQEILKNGKPAPATLEVTDASGKVVHTQKGDLKKFGFT